MLVIIVGFLCIRGLGLFERVANLSQIMLQLLIEPRSGGQFHRAA